MLDNWRNRLNNAKWILTLLMVLYHIQLPSDTVGIEKDVFMYIKNLGDCVVPAFALISGFLFFYNIDVINDVMGKMKRRIWTLLIPYLAWNILNSFYLIFRTNGIRGYLGGLLSFDWFCNVIIGKASPHFWYIFMLMFWTVLSPLVYILIKDKRFSWILFLSQAIYIIYMGNNILHSRFIYILFTWGGYIGYHFPQLAEQLASFKGRKRGTILALSGMIYFGIRLVYMNFSGMGLLVWCYAIRAAVLILFLMNFPELALGKKSGYKFSFWLFSIHFYLDQRIGPLMISRMCPIVGQICTWIAVCCIGLGTGFLVELFLPQIFNIFTGRRKVRALVMEDGE